MKMQLDPDEEWGHFIDPETFKIYQITEEIPDGSLVVLKEREYIEDLDRTIIQTSYGIVEGIKYQPLNKRDISKHMSKACAEYILKENSLPPKIVVEKKLQLDKPAKLGFVMSNYDTFHLQLDKSLLGGSNPIEIINPILEQAASEPDSDDDDLKWKAEYAKSSRATCKSCGLKIEKNTVRIGEPHYYQDHLNYRWNHEKCIFWKRLSLANVKGLDELEETDRNRIEKLLK